MPLRSERAGRVASTEVSTMEGMSFVYDASRGEIIVIIGNERFEMPLSVAVLVAEKTDEMAAAVSELRLLSR